MNIYIASDHGGFHLKNFLCEYLKGKNYTVTDLGPDTDASCDYPIKAKLVAESVLKDEGSFGILICGSGLGMSMTANRFPGIRAALCTTEYHAEYARAHNNANILCLGARVTGEGLAANITEVFLKRQFEGGRHLRRIQLIDSE